MTKIPPPPRPPILPNPVDASGGMTWQRWAFILGAPAAYFGLVLLLVRALT